MATISIHLDDLSGEVDLMAWLRRSDTGALVNTDGDVLTEDPAGSGRFTCTVAETIPSVICRAKVYAGITENPDDLLNDGWLPADGTLITDTYPHSTGSGGGSVVGPGADQVTVTVLDDDNDPVDNMAVWISLDPGGDNVVAGTLYTNGYGEVTFMLTDGATYYLWAEKSGVNSIQGQQFVAVAD